MNAKAFFSFSSFGTSHARRVARAVRARGIESAAARRETAREEAARRRAEAVCHNMERYTSIAHMRSLISPARVEAIFTLKCCRLPGELQRWPHVVQPPYRLPQND
jgi:hypothetical protein